VSPAAEDAADTSGGPRTATGLLPATAGAGPTEEGPATSTCPGCGAVLVVVPGLRATRPGASAGCAGLFGTTVRGLRDEAAADARTAAVLQLAADTYDAQHLTPGEPAAAAARLCLWVARGLDPAREQQVGARLAEGAPRSLTRPDRWTTTIADVAADLDVVDLPSLVRSWAEAVWADWSVAREELCAAADVAQRLQ
jgi:Family of unknown function (DUF5946)